MEKKTLTERQKQMLNHILRVQLARHRKDKEEYGEKGITLNCPEPRSSLDRPEKLLSIGIKESVDEIERQLRLVDTK